MSVAVLAVDLGGTKVETAIVTTDGTILDDTRTRRPTGRTLTTRELDVALTEALHLTFQRLPDQTTLVGVGVGTAGPIDAQAGSTSPINLPGIHPYSIRDAVRRALPRDFPIELSLDGSCITLAESWLGAIRGYDNAAAVVVSTGVGGGVIVDGRLLAGSTGNAGHIGQLRVRKMRDHDPHAGTVESTASGTATVAWRIARFR